MKTNINIKIVFLGASNVGKTSLIMRYCNKLFRPGTLNTIGANFLTKNFSNEFEDITLLLWDTAGDERFRSVTPYLLHGTDGLVLVYDISNKSSFLELDLYYNLFLENIKLENNNNNLPILLFGNKNDLKDIQFSNDFVENWIKLKNIKYYNIGSAKTGENVDETLDNFFYSILLNHQNNEIITIKLSENNNKNEEIKNKNCC